jgi:hypothetical protein
VFYTKAHVLALEAQIERLEQLLADEKSERRQLQDRLLEKRNIEPIQPKLQPSIPDTVQVISPFGGGTTPELVGALKDSWVGEEAAYLQAEHGMAEMQAKEMAEQRWIDQHKAQ